MTPAADWLRRIEQAYGVAPDPGFGPPPVLVPPERWRTAMLVARDQLGCDFFDSLTAVDEGPADPAAAPDASVPDTSTGPAAGPPASAYTVVAHVAAVAPAATTSLLLSTTLPPEAPSVACACPVYAGAAWHERETHEMFGIGFDGHGPLEPLLLPDGFDGHPLRKDFVLASRVAKPWPGAKEPGESESDAAPSRRRTRPPGVPNPGTWGPGQAGSP